MWKEAVIAVGFPVGRSVIAWATHSLADGKVERFELRKLCISVVSVGAVAVVSYLGLNSLGFDVSAVGCAAGAYLFDMVMRKADKLIKARKK